MSGKDVVLVFYRNPEPGKVKTRLAATLGDSEALRIYLLLVEKTRQAVGGLPNVQRWVYYSAFLPQADEWETDFFQKKLQCTGDLGLRLRTAFEEAFDAGAGRVLVVGTDSPGLTAARLAEALDKLQPAVPVVIGPAFDGGYYLLGMNRFVPELFEGIPWSTERVLTETEAKLAALGLDWARLPALRDVDTEADWEAVKHEFSNMR